MKNECCCGSGLTGKERVLKTLNLEEVDRTPWVPYAGVSNSKPDWTQCGRIPEKF